MACVTLISDFGFQDASVAKVKGILMQHVPHLPVVDISHDVPQYHLQQAAYLLTAAYSHFPKGSCHLPLIELFREQPTGFIVAEQEGHYFIAPDNGLLSIAFPGKLSQVYAMPAEADVLSLTTWMHQAASIVNQLQSVPLQELPLIPCNIREAGRHWLPKYDAEKACIECHVMHVDNFGNIVLNLNRETFEHYAQGQPFYIQLLRDEVIRDFHQHYHQVPQGQKMCRFNDAGYLEIAINRGSASKLLGLKVFSEKSLMYSHIRVCFGEPPAQRILRGQLETLHQF